MLYMIHEDSVQNDDCLIYDGLPAYEQLEMFCLSCYAPLTYSKKTWR